MFLHHAHDPFAFHRKTARINIFTAKRIDTCRLELIWRYYHGIRILAVIPVTGMPVEYPGYLYDCQGYLIFLSEYIWLPSTAPTGTPQRTESTHSIDSIRFFQVNGNGWMSFPGSRNFAPL